MTSALPQVFVETPRLRLRSWTEADLPALHRKVFGDPAVMVFSNGVKTLEQVRDWIAADQARGVEQGFSHWAVERKSDDAFIGLCGLKLQPLAEGSYPEVGYRLERAAWGRGLATEAAGGVLQWAWTHTRYPEIIALIHPENLRSVRVVQKLGMRLGWQTDWYGIRHDVYVAERPAREVV
ncbi:MAG: GNAT family N-acetyltransferase [Acidobacteria bacterium]|nr:GNAT family N-acetyltransferase [Acidobacteriota bacterium]